MISPTRSVGMVMVTVLALPMAGSCDPGPLPPAPRPPPPPLWFSSTLAITICLARSIPLFVAP